MLKNIGSKDSWKEMTGVYPLLYQDGNKTSNAQSVKSSMSPNKYNKHNQMQQNIFADN